MDGVLCEISPALLVDGVLQVLPRSLLVNDIMDTRMRIDTGAFNGRMGAGCTWRSSRVTGVLAIISFPYNRPSFSGLFMGVMLYMYDVSTGLRLYISISDRCTCTIQT
jgi:hypothetical protein